MQNFVAIALLALAISKAVAAAEGFRHMFAPSDANMGAALDSFTALKEVRGANLETDWPIGADVASYSSPNTETPEKVVGIFVRSKCSQPSTCDVQVSKVIKEPEAYAFAAGMALSLVYFNPTQTKTFVRTVSNLSSVKSMDVYQVDFDTKIASCRGVVLHHTTNQELTLLYSCCPQYKGKQPWDSGYEWDEKYAPETWVEHFSSHTAQPLQTPYPTRRSG